MNPSNQTGATQSGGSFPSQQSSQTNPFTADLKGEFTSNFGTNTNAVSQIFKDGGFVSNNNTKYIAIAAIVLAAGLGLFFYMTSEDEQVSFDETTAEGDKKLEEGAPTDAASTEQATAGSTEATGMAEQAAPAAETATAPAATGSVVLSAPADGQGRAYDETSGPATFSWEGGGSAIVFSRSQSMKPEYTRIPVSGNSYNFHNPYPGTWFWRVDSADGTSSKVRRFTVENPVRRNVSITEPATGGTLAGSGGVVAWTGDSKVAFYRVEFSSDGNWNNPTHRFATSAERIQTSGVSPGSYQMRIGAFSEVAGRWEYSTPSSVTVQ